MISYFSYIKFGPMMLITLLLQQRDFSLAWKIINYIKEMGINVNPEENAILLNWASTKVFDIFIFQINNCNEEDSHLCKIIFSKIDSHYPENSHFYFPYHIISKIAYNSGRTNLSIKVIYRCF